MYTCNTIKTNCTVFIKECNNLLEISTLKIPTCYK